MASNPLGTLRLAALTLDETGLFGPGQDDKVREAAPLLLASGALPDHPAELFGPWEKLHPSAGGLLAILGRHPSWLLGDYVTSVRVDPRARGFFHEKSRGVTWGYLMGIDLIPTPHGIMCVEANVNTGAYQKEMKELLDLRAAIEGIFEFAQGHGVENLWWHEMDWTGPSWWLKGTLEETAGAKGMNVIIRQDHRAPRRPEYPRGAPQPKRRLTAPVQPPDNTLVIRRNNYGVGSDFVITNKEPFTRGLAAHLKQAGVVGCDAPLMTRRPVHLPPPGDDGLPNIVYKYPDSGKGEGVFFMRVKEIAEAVSLARDLDRRRGCSPGLFQPFVCSHLLPGRRVFDIRVELLLTPVGVSRVMAIRREAATPIPEVLDEGLVASTGVFTSNMSTGGTVSPLSPEDEARVGPAVQAVGDALVSLLSTGFKTAP